MPDTPTLFDPPDDDDEPQRPDPSAEQPGLYPRDGTDTQLAAAYRAAPAAATQRGRLLVLMHDAGDRGLTALEAEQAMLREFPLMRNVRARITELRRADWLLFTGAVRMTATGSPAQVNVFNPDAEADYARWLNGRNPE